MSDLNGKVIKKIKQFRTEKGLSQERLSELAGLDPKYINKLENGRFNLTLPTLERIISALDIEIIDFFENIGTGGSNNYSNLLDYLNEETEGKRELLSLKILELLRIFD